ncbi:hypothetical protein [Pseudomonas asplenii]|uniref:Uncharacterized protein n=1 Tax=Pseudomonas asplenii TaxID=53407 RepID=A0A1H6NR23_9PSED|nr:hypothetical protein [Pseudomonas fuscovaginae]SEI18683.1 hypothetical protein SAMN05216581_3746 [Pseudomonas fuscovaginae]
MTFKSSVMPGVRAFAASMRVKLSREPTRAARPSVLFTVPSASTLALPRATIRWRICPSTGRLQQRWDLADLQEPPSSRLAPRPQHAREPLAHQAEVRAA